MALDQLVTLCFTLPRRRARLTYRAPLVLPSSRSALC